MTVSACICIEYQCSRQSQLSGGAAKALQPTMPAGTPSILSTCHPELLLLFWCFFFVHQRESASSCEHFALFWAGRTAW